MHIVLSLEFLKMFVTTLKTTMFSLVGRCLAMALYDCELLVVTERNHEGASEGPA